MKLHVGIVQSTKALSAAGFGKQEERGGWEGEDVVEVVNDSC